MIAYYRLFDYLRRKGIKHSDLIKNDIINPGTLQRMRENRDVSTRTLDKLCEHLGCRIEDICEYEKK